MPKFGIIGVAVGTLVAMAYRTGFHIWYLKNNILNRKIKHSIKIISIFAMGLIISVIFKFIDVNVISWIVYAIKNSILVLLIYFIIIIIFYKDIVKEIINKIIPSRH